MAIAAALELDGRLSDGLDLHRQCAEHAHDVPVTLVLGEITESIVGIEQQIFIPTEKASGGVYIAHLKADHLKRLAIQLAARAERDLGLDALLTLKLLEDLELGCGGIQNTEAVRANDVQRVGETA